MKIDFKHKNYLKKAWGDIGEKITKGFQCDLVSAAVVKFFCTERANYYKSLEHNPYKGLILMGSKGIGKTANLLIYRQFQIRVNGVGMKCISAKEIESKFKTLGEAYIQELVDYPELMIDDIGTESQRLKDYGTDRNLIHDILMLRYVKFQRNECVTHATTNLNLELMKEFYDPRLIDRMKEMFVLVKVTGKSRRK